MYSHIKAYANVGLIYIMLYVFDLILCLFWRQHTYSWHFVNIPTTGQHVEITLYRDHYHPRQYVKRIVASTPMSTGGTSGSYTWPKVKVDSNYNIDEFYVIRICWVEQNNICGVSDGVMRVEQNVHDRTHIPGGTGLVGSDYEWERISTQINYDPAEGYHPNSLNKYL